MQLAFIGLAFRLVLISHQNSYLKIIMLTITSCELHLVNYMYFVYQRKYSKLGNYNASSIDHKLCYSPIHFNFISNNDLLFHLSVIVYNSDLRN